MKYNRKMQLYARRKKWYSDAVFVFHCCWDDKSLNLFRNVSSKEE